MSDAQALGLVGGVFVFAIIILAASYVISSLGYYFIFKKSNVESWKGWVPFYRVWTVVEVAKLNWWWFLIALASNIVSIIFSQENNSALEWLARIASAVGNYAILFNLCKKANKSNGMAILGIFFPGLAYLIMGASGEYQFDDSVQLTPNGPFDANKGNSTNNVNNNTVNNNSGSTSVKFCPNCGGSLNGDKFCPNCGSKVDE